MKPADIEVLREHIASVEAWGRESEHGTPGCVEDLIETCKKLLPVDAPGGFASALAEDAAPKPALKLVSAGVDDSHQTHHCDDCGKVFPSEDDESYDAIQTCSHTEYLTLCQPCYRKRGNGVR